LTPAQRELLDERYTAGNSVQSVAQKLGQNTKAIYQALYRLRLSLMACVQRKLMDGK
jgi:RNA polymerase sigma-70 factor (ECF subfamily)